MATYAAVVSLMRDLEQFLNSYALIFELDSCPFTEKELEILYRSVSLMDSFLLDSSGSVETYNLELINQPWLERRIRHVAQKAGIYVDLCVKIIDYYYCYSSAFLLGMIEYHFLEQAVECLRRDRLRFCMLGTKKEDPYLKKIVEELGSVNEELKKVHDDRNVLGFEDASFTGNSSTVLSPSRAPKTEGELVGLEEELVTLLDNLTGHPPYLRVFSIIGMAGIGKTTFSKRLYDNALVMHHFYVRIWLTVSQRYNVREMLLGILRCVTNVSDEIYAGSNEQLREQVYRKLKGKRYLIVLDDMWDMKVWDYLKRTFPDDKNGSRILLTTRLRDVAVHASQDTPPYCLRCLSTDESWELLISKIFGEESCPLELVAVGKQIACQCQGLPLAIVVLAGLLSKMDKKLDVWEVVAQRVSSLVMGEAEHCQNILVLSYNHLPDQLKACFLYMGNFPEDYEISVKILIRLWVAEGFIRPSMLKSLEEVAEGLLEDLTSRSLVLIGRKSSDGRIKTCYIHDLMRELCLRQSEKQNFLHVINSRGDVRLPFGVRQAPPSHLHSLRRLSFHSSISDYIRKTSIPYSRSVMCFEKVSISDPCSWLGMNFKLLTVLNFLNVHLTNFPREINHMKILKFLALTILNSLDTRFLFILHSLQTIVVDCEWHGNLPGIMWDMLKLRHLDLKRSCLSSSVTYSKPEEVRLSSASVLELADAETSPVLKNLQSLSTIRPISCRKKVFLSMPNLKKLGIYETEEDSQFRGWFKRLVHLRELEKLKYVFSNPFVRSDLKPDPLPSWECFPPKLVKLSLSGTSLPWEDMSNLGMLPKLEVLKLRNYAFSGAVWKSTRDSFRCLKFLLIGSTNLETWEADRIHFPNLQHLVLRHCRFLKEIPCGIVEAPLLETIELHCCKDSAVMSTRQLQEEQQSQGNDLLTLRITEG